MGNSTFFSVASSKFHAKQQILWHDMKVCCRILLALVMEFGHYTLRDMLAYACQRDRFTSLP